MFVRNTRPSVSLLPPKSSASEVMFEGVLHAQPEYTHVDGIYKEGQSNCDVTYSLTNLQKPAHCGQTMVGTSRSAY